MSAGVHEANQPMPERRTYTLDETARMLGISERFLRELIYQGLVPVLRLGRRVLVRSVTVERLLAEPEGAQAPITQLLEARAERTRTERRERTGQTTARQA